MEKFSPENRLQDISQMTQKITADKRLAGSEDFETIRKIADEYEILKAEMRRNSQTKMLVLNASVTKFLQQELSDLEKNGTALSTDHHRALKKLERALDFNQDFNNEYRRQNTRVGDGIFRNFFKSESRREADARKVHELEIQNNHIDNFVFNPNDLQKTINENIDLGLKNIQEKILKISNDGKLGGTEDFKEIKEMTKFFDDIKKSQNSENIAKIFSSQEVLYLRSMILEIWKNKAHYIDEHFRYLWKFEESLYPNKNEMPAAERKNQVISALFSSNARDRADEKAAAYEKELSHNVISPFIATTQKIENFSQNNNLQTIPQENIQTKNPETQVTPEIKTEKIPENTGTLNFLNKDLPTENHKITFFQIGLNLLNKDNSLNITGNKDEATDLAIKKFQENFDKKFPNAYKNPNENPFERTIHNLWFELSQWGFDTVKIISEASKKTFSQSESTISSTKKIIPENQKIPEQTEQIYNHQNITYLQLAMHDLSEKFPQLKGKIKIANGIADENFKENLKILQKNLNIPVTGTIDQTTLEWTRKVLGEAKHNIIFEDAKNSKISNQNEIIQNTETQNLSQSQEAKKSQFTPTEKEIIEWSKNPMEITNETVKNFYIQRALNIVKSNISEIKAKIIIAEQENLELTGKMDDRTTKAIEAFQKYINHYKYYSNGTPLSETGKMDQATMNTLVWRVNLSWNTQSRVALDNAIKDFNSL